jgi:hypothetical protein
MIIFLKRIYYHTCLLEWAVWSLAFLVLFSIPPAVLFSMIYIRPLIELWRYHPERYLYL